MFHQHSVGRCETAEWTTMTPKRAQDQFSLPYNLLTGERLPKVCTSLEKCCENTAALMFNGHVVFRRLPVHLLKWTADQSMNQATSLASQFTRQKEDQGSGVSLAAYWLTRTLATFEQSVQHADVTFPTRTNAVNMSPMCWYLHPNSVPVHAKNSRCLWWYRHPNRVPVHARNSRFLGWTNWCIGWKTNTGFKSDYLQYGWEFTPVSGWNGWRTTGRDSGARNPGRQGRYWFDFASLFPRRFIHCHGSETTLFKPSLTTVKNVSTSVCVTSAASDGLTTHSADV